MVTEVKVDMKVGMNDDDGDDVPDVLDDEVTVKKTDPKLLVVVLSVVLKELDDECLCWSGDVNDTTRTFRCRQGVAFES